MAQDLTSVLPADLRHGATETGSELIFPYPEALGVVDLATRKQIAILGVEAFEVRRDGFKTLDYSGYEIPFTGDWGAFVAANNTEAKIFIETRRLGENHGYILTSTSQREFVTLPDRVG